MEGCHGSKRKTGEGEPQRGSGDGEIQLSGQVTVDTEVRARDELPLGRKGRK